MTKENAIRVENAINLNGVNYGLPKSAGRMLSDYRKSKKLSLNEVAEVADMTIFELQAIEHDAIHRLDACAYDRIARAMGSTVYQVFQLDEGVDKVYPGTYRPATYRRLMRESLRTPLWKLARERGRRITHLMRERGITQAELARRTGLTTGEINYELYASTLRAKSGFVSKVAAALDVSIDMILGNEDKTYIVSVPKMKRRMKIFKQTLGEVARKSGISEERLSVASAFAVNQKEMDYLCDALHCQYNQIKLTSDERVFKTIMKRIHALLESAEYSVEDIELISSILNIRIDGLLHKTK